MEILELTPDRLDEVASFVAALQQDPATHIGFDSMVAPVIAEEYLRLEPDGLGGTLVADDDGRLVGVIALEWDTSPPRAWWHGPYVASHVDWDGVADAMAAAAYARVPDDVTQHELAPDARNERVAAFAHRHGFAEEEGSAVLRRSLATLPEAPALAGVTVRPLHGDDRSTVATLHDELFLNTHTPGDRIEAGDDRWVFVAVDDVTDLLLGYVAVDRDQDGSGYVDFLGVDPAARGRGLGRMLVAAGAATVHRERNVGELHLTVRVSNAAARHLYAALDFVEERVLVPYRRGFTLAPPPAHSG